MKKIFHDQLALALSTVLLMALPASSYAKQKSQNTQDIKNQLQTAYNELVLKKVKTKKSSKKLSNTHLLKKIRNNNQARYKAISVAKQQLRKKYRWGGTSPHKGFDCSGLTQYAYNSVNINLPRTASQQFKGTKRVSPAQMQPGDLVFFHTRRSKARINHVGLYLGDGKFIHAPRRGKLVSVSKLDSYWKRHLIGAGRVLKQS